MKFDRVVKKILLEDLYHNDTYGNSSYIKEPEESLKTLDKAYKFLKNYDVSKYNHNISPQDNIAQNKPIIDAVEAITIVMRDSGLDNFRVDGKNMDKVSLAKNVIKLASRFGQNNFATTAEQNEKKEKLKALFKGENKIESKRKYNNERMPYVVIGGNYPDLDGNPIPNGTKLSGTDYRLYIFARSGVQVRLHGGIEKIQECFKYLFTVVNLRYQPYNKADEAAKKLEDFQNLQYETLYWWGENSLPFRSLITVQDGHVRSVPVPGQNEPKVGLLQFTSDKVGGHKKARPMSQVGYRTYVGSPDGEVIEGVRVGDPIGEVKEKMESQDFPPIAKENKEVNELWDAAKNGDANAKQKLKDAVERHKNYLKLIVDGNWKEIKRIYDERAKNYWEVYNDPKKYPGNQRRGELTEETSMPDGWPFFHIFEDKGNGKFGKPLPVNAKTKYESLYPKNIKEIAQLFYKDIVTQ